jgi:Rrf2 family iron-sulfur cluster assembly transcriptional regulator
MQLSSKGRYAVMAMVDLAAQDACCGPVSLTCVADRQQLSLCYLEQLFGPLRRAGLVISARGPGGGYRLARPAGSIAIAEIIEAVEEPFRATRCDEKGQGCLRDAAGGPKACLTHDLWVELGRQIDLFLRAVTLADVVQGRVSGRAVALAMMEDA